MDLYFNDEHKANGLHEIELENVVFYAERISGDLKSYKLYGVAIVDDERYNDFTVKFETISVPEEESIESVMSLDWEWYDYDFS